MNLETYLATKVELVNRALDSCLPPENTYPPVVHQAMRYSVFSGGKRLRPVMVLATAEAMGGTAEMVMPYACAVELLHTYSLIHDDLPAMDNDDYRRGKPTSHRTFGEANAILAGDALLTYTFALLAHHLADTEQEANRGLQVIAELAEAAGSCGLIGGQVMDLEAEGGNLDAAVLDYIHQHKTGALFRATVRGSAILCGATPEQMNALNVYSENLGLAFQIKDDILNVTGDSRKLGKSTGSDSKRQKVTYPALYGLDNSKLAVREYSLKAVASLASFGETARWLRELALYLVNRDH